MNKIRCYTGVGEVPNRVVCKHAIRRKPYRNSRCIDLRKQRILATLTELRENSRKMEKIEL